MEYKCPYHEDEDLAIMNKRTSGYCVVCRKAHLLAKIAELRKPRLKVKFKPNMPYPLARKVGRI